MQATGQYGVSDQFAVPRPPPALMFALSQDMSHGHPHHLHPSLQHQHVQQQQHHQQHQHHQHHHLQHPQHTQHPQHSQHAQHPQHQQQQQQQHLQQQHAQQQQVMAQQLGLGPDSPEEPSPDGGDPSPTSSKQRESQGDDDGGEDEGRGVGGNRWPRQETLNLIKIRSEMDANFRDSSLKGPLWEDVSRRLMELGYQRSAKKCKEKFENVHKYYKKTKDGRAGRQDGKSYRFFSQLDALYGSSSNSQHVDGGSFMLTGGSGGVIGGGAEGNVSSQGPVSNNNGLHLSSDSDEDDFDDLGDNNDDPEKSKKRKRKETREGNSAKMVYFESLLKKLMEKQEAMQRKFLETVERREHDRLAREDAWRRQETTRMAREHEMRAQEHALAVTRDAALVAFLQKVTGQTLQLPQIVPPQPLNLVVPEIHQAEDQQEESFDPSKRWPKPEVHALIRLRSQLEPKFQEAGPKGLLWEEISTGMACLGFSRNSKRCKEKWENINKYFRKSKEMNKKRPENAKTCPYFQQLDMLYRNGALGGSGNKLIKLEENSDDLVDHSSNRENNEHNQDGVGDGILAIMPAGEGIAAASTNGGASHFYSSADNGSSGDRSLKKVTKQTQILTSPSNGDDHSSTPMLALNFDGLHRGDGVTFSGKSKSVRLEGLVKNMLEQQQQQHHQHQMRFEDDFEREEHERQQQEDRFAQEHGGFPQEILCTDGLGGKMDSERIF